MKKRKIMKKKQLMWKRHKDLQRQAKNKKTQINVKERE